jgi:hypothetical protein
MKLFGRKAANARSPVQPGPASHRFTLDLSRAEKLAMMLAHSRASRVVEVADMVAGMYIYGWDRLSKFWDTDDHERIEGVLRTICRISPQRWHHWMEYYDGQKHSDSKVLEAFPILGFLKGKPIEDSLRPSATLTGILKEAEALTPFHDRSEGKTIPILTSECVLLCIVRSYGTDISRKLAASGLNVPELERAALSTRRSRDK